MSSIFPTRLNGAGVDLSPRVTRTATVVGSPAAAAETVIASLTIPQPVQVNLGVVLIGYAAFTMGTDGVSFNLKLRQTGTSGTTLKASGLLELAATKLGAGAIVAVDVSPTLPGQVYVMTLTATLGSAPSTVSAVELVALVI